MDITASPREAIPFPLFDLPLELLEHIYSYLDYRSICVLVGTHSSLRNVIRPRLPLIRIKRYNELVRCANESRDFSYACWQCLQVIARDNYWHLPLYYTSHAHGSVAYRLCPSHCEWQLISDAERGIDPTPLPWRTRDRFRSLWKRNTQFTSVKSRLSEKRDLINFRGDIVFFLYSSPVFAVAVALNVNEQLGSSEASMLAIMAVSIVSLETERLLTVTAINAYTCYDAPSLLSGEVDTTNKPLDCHSCRYVLRFYKCCKAEAANSCLVVDCPN